MPIHRIKLKDLDKDYIRKLQEQYPDKEIEVEIHVPVPGPSEEPMQPMPEDQFWEIIGSLDWAKEGDDEAVLEPAVQRLSEFPEKAIYSFYDILSEKLFLLDGREYAIHSTEEENHFSADLFLYGRCCVVANGREVYERVLNNPATFPKDLFFEALLQLPEKAYFRKTGKPLEHIPKYIYETGFNPGGWGEEVITL